MSRACCCSSPECRLYGCAQDRADRITYPRPGLPPPLVPAPFAPSGWSCPACGGAHPPSVTSCPHPRRVMTGSGLMPVQSGMGEPIHCGPGSNPPMPAPNPPPGFDIPPAGTGTDGVPT